MHQLEATLTELGEMLSQMPLQEAHVFPCRPWHKCEEHDPIEHIEVGYLSGAMHWKPRWRLLRPHHATRLLHRRPCACPACCGSPSLRIHAPTGHGHQRSQLAFKELVQQAGSRDQKFELVHLAPARHHHLAGLPADLNARRRALFDGLHLGRQAEYQARHPRAGVSHAGGQPGLLSGAIDQGRVEQLDRQGGERCPPSTGRWSSASAAGQTHP